MEKSDRIIFGFISGILIIVLFSLVFSTIGFYIYRDDTVKYFVFAGLFSGAVADIIFIKRIIDNLYDLPAWFAAFCYILGNIFIYGFFMGFPVFNVLTGVIAGYYTGRKITIKNIVSPEKENLIGKVLMFSVLIIILVCISSAYLALNEKTIGEQLKGMLGLWFVPGKCLVITVIVTGGLLLIAIQYYLTKFTILKTISFWKKDSSDK